MAGRKNRDRLNKLDRKQLQALCIGLLDIIGPSAAHRLLPESPISPASSGDQLDLYSVDVDGIADDIATALLALYHATDPTEHSRNEQMNAALTRCHDAVSQAAVTDLSDALELARLGVATVARLKHAGLSKGQAHTARRRMASNTLNTLGTSVAEAASTTDTFSAFAALLEYAASLGFERSSEESMSRALNIATAETRMAWMTAWFGGRTSWSPASHIVAAAWCATAADKQEREEATALIGVHVGESPRVSAMLATMHGEAGAVDEASYWADEGVSRFPDDSSVDAAAQRWS